MSITKPIAYLLRRINYFNKGAFNVIVPGSKPQLSITQ